MWPVCLTGLSTEESWLVLQVADRGHPVLLLAKTGYMNQKALILQVSTCTSDLKGEVSITLPLGLLGRDRLLLIFCVYSCDKSKNSVQSMDIIHTTRGEHGRSYNDNLPHRFWLI